MNANLNSLINFPQFGNLKTLDISNNKIKNGLEKLHKYKNLKCLCLSMNLIDSENEILKLGKFTNLTRLYLHNNPYSIQ